MVSWEVGLRGDDKVGKKPQKKNWEKSTGGQNPASRPRGVGCRRGETFLIQKKDGCEGGLSQEQDGISRGGGGNVFENAN